MAILSGRLENVLCTETFRSSLQSLPISDASCITTAADQNNIFLNGFNSRSIINIWTQVSRKERKEALIHKKILQKVDADMLNVPFERDKSLGVKLAKSSGMSYLVATYVKYLAEKTIFEYRNRSGRKRTGEKTDHNGG